MYVCHCMSLYCLRAVDAWSDMCCRYWKRLLALSSVRSCRRVSCLTTSTTSYRHVSDSREMKWSITCHSTMTTTPSTASNPSADLLSITWSSTVVSSAYTTSLTLWRPLLPYGYSYKASVPDWVKPSFVILDIWALWRSGLSVRVPGCQKLQMTVWHRMLHSCTRMATVGVKGLTQRSCSYPQWCLVVKSSWEQLSTESHVPMTSVMVVLSTRWRSSSSDRLKCQRINIVTYSLWLVYSS